MAAVDEPKTDEGDQSDVRQPQQVATPKAADKPEQTAASIASPKQEAKTEIASPPTKEPPEEEKTTKKEQHPDEQLQATAAPVTAAEKPLAERRLEKRGREAKAKGEKPSETPKVPPGIVTGTDVDDFGLPIRKTAVIQYSSADETEDEAAKKKEGGKGEGGEEEGEPATAKPRKWSLGSRRSASQSGASRSRASSRASSSSRRRWSLRGGDGADDGIAQHGVPNPPETTGAAGATDTIEEEPRTPMPPKPKTTEEQQTTLAKVTSHASTANTDRSSKRYTKDFATEHAREAEVASSAAAPNALSEFSHQKLTTEDKKEKEDEDDGWQTMPAFAPYDIYDDDNKLIAREHVETEEDSYGYSGLGGAGKGYTRVFVDDDVESATSMDDNTQYLFKSAAGTSMLEDEEEQRDAVSQMQATKDLLTESQRIAYVGITRLHLTNLINDAETLIQIGKRRKDLQVAAESMKMWSQKMMIRLYAHMDVSVAEQVMIEQLSDHGVKPDDLTPALMANARVKNPMAATDSDKGDKSARGSLSSPKPPGTPVTSSTPSTPVVPSTPLEEAPAEPPPPYQERALEELPGVRTPSQLPETAKIDIDLRWTVLCDLFLVLIADSIYDARSRVLLERVGQSLEVPAIDICKFERKVTEALEMQQNAEKENWDEKDHMEMRRKMALKRRYVMMGLATVGGGLVIGLSAGLLAPVIGAGLAAGFTTIGVTGTSSFLAGAGGAAIITSSAAASGSVIGVRAADRRTGAVKTFEYRPLHNNKRVNLIVTVSGWMTGKVDDVRLPFSTVDPVMGDLYSVLWEPEMLTSMGDTINILATEALTQGLQQILGSTILVSLMAALQLPVVLTKLSYLIDNPWAVSLDRATMAGLILADSLVDRNLGTRPITLVGYSLGSRVIFSCLKELSKKGAYGLVQNVFLFGSPIVVKPSEYLRARSVVAGRFVNGYNRNDWILGYLFRLTSGGIRRIAGLGEVTCVPDVENMDVTEFVVGHMDYRTAMPRLLRECGWLVESDEFTEIEDPDPENHGQRQRELINEIEEARKELEKEGKAKKGNAFTNFFTRKKKEKQAWEIYDDPAGKGKGTTETGATTTGKTEDAEGNNHGVLFDVDAIRAELAKEVGGKAEDVQLEQLQVRELKSTLPPMKLDLHSTSSPSLTAPARVTPRPSLGSSSVENVSLSEPRASDSPATPFRLSQDHRSSSYSFDNYPKAQSYRYAAAPAPSSIPPPERASTFPNHVVTDNEGISMTFDSSFDDSPPRAPTTTVATTATATAATTTTTATATTTTTTSSYTSPTPITSFNPPAPPPKDPGYRSSVAPSGASNATVAASAATGATGATAGLVAGAAVPAITLSDPWADDDELDEDFGKEQEISMTFA